MKQGADGLAKQKAHSWKLACYAPSEQFELDSRAHAPVRTVRKAARNAKLSRAALLPPARQRYGAPWHYLRSLSQLDVGDVTESAENPVAPTTLTHTS